ncbi:MAG: hypothetical protein B7Z73_03300 [Planctomycetia bacterium 21-64-5]|nr:MAG: hypothetical protein B7Z73_03300 [Planctomycetia bacterium 21-64-5]HQU41229.1 histidine kinase dimerization/phospho-acceptor domain-containing protein [Pirellulales bacterium]
MNLLPGRRDAMIARALPPGLGAATVLSAAAALATCSAWTARQPWLLQFGFQTLAIAAAAAPFWLWARWAASDKPAVPLRSAAHRGPLAEFLLVANHEMKTPLAGIKAYVELLADGDADDDVTREEFLNGISSQAQRLEEAIDDLLERARAEAEVSLAGDTLADHAAALAAP